MDIFLIIGYIGTFTYLVGYYLLQTRKIGNGYMYSIFNMVGAILLTTSLVIHENQAALLSQITWFLLSAYGAYLFYKTSKKEKINRLELVLEDSNREIPRYVIAFKDKEIIEIYDYNHKKFWNEMEFETISISKGNYFLKQEKQKEIIPGQLESMKIKKDIIIDKEGIKIHSF